MTDTAPASDVLQVVPAPAPALRWHVSGGLGERLQTVHVFRATVQQALDAWQKAFPADSPDTWDAHAVCVDLLPEDSLLRPVLEALWEARSKGQTHGEDRAYSCGLYPYGCALNP